MKRLPAVLLAVLGTVGVQGQTVEISVAPTGQAVRAQLSWQAIPSQTYAVEGSPSLMPAAWTNTTPALTASNVLGAFATVLTNRAYFFRVQKLDTDPPAVTNLLPGSNAIAVVSNAAVSIALADETGIATNTIRLSVAEWTNLTVTSPGVVWSNDTVVFTPTGVLGQAGAVITNMLTVADTLGHTLSNLTWTFQLARETVATNAFLPLTAPPGGAAKSLSDGTTRLRSLPGVRPLDGTDEYHIVAVTSNSVVFSYATTPPAITNGTRLVSFDAAYPFYRVAISNTVNPAQQQITAWTTNVPLTDLLSQGAMSSIAFAPAQPQQGPQTLWGGSLNLLHVEFGDDLSGRVLYENAGLKLWLPAASWSFVGAVDVAFDIAGRELRSLDASAAGRLTISVTPEAIFNQAISGDGEIPLIQPVTRIFGGMAGPVPVWVEVTMELNAGYEYAASVSGNAHTTVNATNELTFYVCLRDSQWTHGCDKRFTWQADPITWQLEGTANAKVYVQPKLTALVYSLAGLWADISPYAEIEGWYQANPLEYELALYFGLSSTLGIESRIWYPGWGDKPEWTLFDQRWPLWSTAYPAAGAPAFAAGFPNRTVQVGQRLTLSGHAVGNPTPAYRWYFNGSPVVGANAPEYVISSAQPGHQGTYAVQAYNSAGSVQTSCYVTVSSGAGDYMIVDLSAGPSASSYPVSYMTGVPGGGWTEEHKTTKLVLRRIPAGTFTMGSPVGELGRDSNETQHQVTLTQPFYIGVFEVTQKQWERVMGNWPSYFNNVTYRDSRPVEQVSYYDIRENPANSAISPNWPQSSQVHAGSFMGKLRAKTGLTTLDLPTESQWEYACRAGVATALNSGYNLTNTSSDARMAAVGRYWYNGGSAYRQGCAPSAGTATAGSYLVNQWGLYDMHGNVWEWCLDWYAATYPGSVQDPPGAASGSHRVLRGGSWFDDARYCRSADRLSGNPSSRIYIFLGFRVARTLP